MRAMNWWGGGLIVLGLALPVSGWAQGQPVPTPDSVPPTVRPDTGTYVVEPGFPGGGPPGIAGPGIPIPEGAPAEESAEVVALTVLYAVVPDEPLALDDAPEALWERLEALQNAGKLSSVSRWQFTTHAGQEFESMTGESLPVTRGFNVMPGGRGFGGPAGEGDSAARKQPVYAMQDFGTVLNCRAIVDGPAIQLDVQFEQTRFKPAEPGMPDGLPGSQQTKLRNRVMLPDGSVAVVGGRQTTTKEQVETAILLVRGRILSHREPARLGQRTLHAIPLRFAQADAVVEILRSSLEGSEFADAIVRSDARSNRIILAAAVDHIESLKQLIRLLDEAGQPGRQQPVPVFR